MRVNVRYSSERSCSILATRMRLVTDRERLHDISHHLAAERDVAWLVDQLAERDARIAVLEARLIGQ